jgi:UDP-N-acetylmuramyl tripeptide synthase
VAAVADVAILTADNPRHEDPERIAEAVAAGMGTLHAGALVVERDRAVAIGRAIDLAGPDDLVLIAGRGHETHQEIGDRRIPFVDADVARAALEARAGSDA